MGWLTGLFGSSKSVETVVDTAAKGLYNGIDKIFYTDEEKADARAKAGELFLRFTEKALDQNSIRSITRRWLAFMVVCPMMLFFIASGVSYPFSPELATHLYKVFSDLVPWGTGILATYFGPHLIGAIRK
jgi:hypothetical protein